ncbi:hypothetical protein PY74_09770 [Lacticaseibacillus rhamnosus]|nr:YopX family protein [Lacticaseibacillus rhamnosus]OAU74640.1 hypothetical protein PY74_09770 [Lacticaseibacillus rhamnosus]
MKREIKFRAWQPQVKRMFEVGDIDFIKEEVMLCHWGWESLNDIDLMQYAGREDNNKRKIYEGDIVSFGSVWDNGDNEDLDEEIHIGVVEYDPHYAVYDVNCEESGERRFLFTDVVNYDGFGVIGNIFEDKQLLEGK